MNTLETLVNALIMHRADTDSDLHKKCCPSGNRFANFLQQCTETPTKKYMYRTSTSDRVIYSEIKCQTLFKMVDRLKMG